MPHDTRDAVVDFVWTWSERTELPVDRFAGWLGVARGKLFDWRKRYGKVNEHNALVPRNHWLVFWEKKAILDFYAQHPLEGYRRLAFMMLDKNIVAVSPASVYRVLSGAGLLDRWNRKPSKKGTGFIQPLAPHEHWHIDIAYLNIAGTFYYMCSILDGASRAIVHWEIREAMTEPDVEIIVQRGLELHPTARPRIISDNGPQFVAKDFKEFIRVACFTAMIPDHSGILALRLLVPGPKDPALQRPVVALESYVGWTVPGPIGQKERLRLPHPHPPPGDEQYNEQQRGGQAPPAPAQTPPAAETRDHCSEHISSARHRPSETRTLARRRLLP